jgi:hypothetical protein
MRLPIFPSTGFPDYWGWLLLSLLVVIPVLVLLPVVAIAIPKSRFSVQENKWLWICLFLLVGAFSYTTLWWASVHFALAADTNWPVIYLWVLPSWLLWFLFLAKRRKRVGIDG